MGALIRPPAFALAAVLTVLLSACGDSEESYGTVLATSGPGNGSAPRGDGWIEGLYQPSGHYTALCQNPRYGRDPVTGVAYPDRLGTALDENNWVRSWTNELYLWYSEVPDLDPGAYASTATYFSLLKTPALTSTGNPKDRFHFTYPTTQWESMSLGGVDIGYGVTWDIAVAAPPRQLYVAFVWPGNFAAANAGLARGLEITQIDGVDAIHASDQVSVDTLNQGLSPTSAGETHTFTLHDPVAGTDHAVTLEAAAVTETPVPIVTTLQTDAGPVGYILFNDHIATSERELIDGISSLKAADVTDLILDIRYNGGGLLDIASELAYMIAGPGPTAGEAFDRIAFNARYPSTDPVTGQPLTPTPFHTVSQGFSATPAAGTTLPYLGLTRVFVLTGPGTCSASEAIMNGLNGVDVQVIQIGSTTCGKPYGFYPQDNCGTTYFSIEFQSDNATGFGNYPDGFSPANSTMPTSAVLPGCSVADDFTHPLGDAAEGRLAAALGYRASGRCTVPATGLASPAIDAQPQMSVHRAPWRENSILRTR
ncbi:MAG TPA: S41 family peptidase [Steroidobacteraceae bacterium]|jgi:hypothetical protein|nr:S41 family peptidase [Steroidobacteraceae bacterium]